jgi:hypothetical protein
VVVALAPREVAGVVYDERCRDEPEPRITGREGDDPERATHTAVVNPEPSDVQAWPPGMADEPVM